MFRKLYKLVLKHNDVRILMVCLGNICRSPLAQGIAEKVSRERGLDWEVDSAGTSAWHAGEEPDARSLEIARSNGIDISKQRARMVLREDLKTFDLILAMDSSNYNELMQLANGDRELESKIHLILNYAYPGENRAVPDPYYDGGFQRVYELLENAIDKLAEDKSS